MKIFWLGLGCIKIQNGDFNILLFPYSKESGLKPVRGKYDLVLIGNPKEKGSLSSLSKDYFLIDGPGEYEVKEVFI